MKRRVKKLSNSLPGNKQTFLPGEFNKISSLAKHTQDIIYRSPYCLKHYRGHKLYMNTCFWKNVSLKYSVNYDILCHEENTFNPCITLKYFYAHLSANVSQFLLHWTKKYNTRFFLFFNIKLKRIYN